MEAPDKITISLKNNPDLAAKFAGVAAGDTVALDGVECTVDEVAEDLLTMSVDDIDEVKVTPNDSEDDSEEVDDNAPVMQVMASSKYQKP